MTRHTTTTLIAEPMPRRMLLGGFVLLSGALLAGITPVRGAEGKVVRIGTQKSGTFNILRVKNVLEDALGPKGVTVTWREFPGGPQMLEALNVGAIDFATTGEAPPIFAQAASAPLLYVGVQPSAPTGEAILVRKDSDLKTAADLKGKRVALNKGSNVHYLLVQALASAGLKPSDIRPIYLPPADARAAFEQGSVDAWAIWDPYLSAAREATGARILVDATGLAPNRQYLLASRSLAETQPETVRTILELVEKTDRWTNANRAEAAQLLSPGMGLPVPIVLAAFDGIGFGVEPITPDIIAAQQKIADTFEALGLIPRHIDIRDAVWTPKA